MLRNYFKTAFRNLRKQRFYAVINILGLAVGIACCLLISLWVRDELSYDLFHEKADRVYRAGSDIKFGEMEFRIAYMPAPFRDALVQDMPEVVRAGRFRENGSRLVRVSGTDAANIKVERMAYADPEIFEMLTFDILEGDPISGLVEPNTVAINRSTKELFFPDRPALGQVLQFNDNEELKIVAVYDDLPQNSHIQLNMMVSMESHAESKSTEWLSNNFITYMELAEGASIAELEEKFPPLIDKYVGPAIQQFLGNSMEEVKASGNHIFYYTLGMGDIHLDNSETMQVLEPGGDWTYVYIFSAVAFFILLIACVNFMNLATARSAGRAREVGVRKALGSKRWDLIGQFLIESLVVAGIAFVLGVLLAEFMLPAFNELANKDLLLPWPEWWFVPILLGGIAGVGLLAGTYPAFFLSAFQPVHVFKGALGRGAKSANLRSVLVVFQFATSIVLIVATGVVYRQLNYVQQKKIGFNKDQVLILEGVFSLGNEKARALKQEILAYPEVSHAAITSYLPVSGYSRSNTAFWPMGNRTAETSVITQYWQIDHDFVKTMGMEIVEGRDFSLDFPTDSTGAIFNEEAIRQFGFADPIGERIEVYGGGVDEEGNPNVLQYTVVGVVKDFHYESLKENVAPLVLTIGDHSGTLAVRLKSNEVEGLLAKAEAKWREFAPTQPFNYTFMDERFASMYSQEQQIGKIFAAFAGLAIVIACLGLFALAAFMAEQRTKEISIRKVLGANVKQIVLLLSGDFMKLVAIALIVAVPVGWYSMDKWLESYAYKVSVDIWTFLLAGGVALLIALLTVSSQSIRAAHTNPGNSLRNE